MKRSPARFSVRRAKGLYPDDDDVSRLGLDHHRYESVSHSWVASSLPGYISEPLRTEPSRPSELKPRVPPFGREAVANHASTMGSKFGPRCLPREGSRTGSQLQFTPSVNISLSECVSSVPTWPNITLSCWYFRYCL